MFKNSPPICYIFFATDDVTVMSVNTYTSMMRLALKISTWSYLYDKIRNMEQSNCLNCFLTETEVLMDWKRWSKKMTTQVLCGQCKVNHYPIRQTTVPVLSVFFISAIIFSKSKKYFDTFNITWTKLIHHSNPKPIPQGYIIKTRDKMIWIRPI